MVRVKFVVASRPQRLICFVSVSIGTFVGLTDVAQQVAVVGLRLLTELAAVVNSGGLLEASL